MDCVALVRPFASGPETLMHLELRDTFPRQRIVLVEHHAAHAASAYFASPFDEATVLTLDRARRFPLRRALAAPSGSALTLEKELYYPDSLGDLYGRVTELLGFEPNADEHKVQWLSTSGRRPLPRPVPRDPLARATAAGPRIDRSFFDGERAEPRRLQRAVLSSASASRTAPRFPRRMRAVAGGGTADAPSSRRWSRWPATARTSAWPAGSR